MDCRKGTILFVDGKSSFSQASIRSGVGVGMVVGISVVRVELSRVDVVGIVEVVDVVDVVFSPSIAILERSNARSTSSDEPERASIMSICVRKINATSINFIVKSLCFNVLFLKIAKIGLNIVSQHVYIYVNYLYHSS